MAREYPSGAEAAARARAGSKIDKVAAKAAMLEQHAAKHAEVAAKLSKTAERVAAKAKQLEQRLAEDDARSAMAVWLRAAPGSRRPRFTRDDLAAAAVRIADEEGFDALSMRRLAAELDAGTMTLYHYVRNKDELMALVVDEIMSEVALPPGQELPADWRAAVTTIARRTRDCLRRHPWVLDLRDDPGIGPNSVHHFDQSLAAASRLSDDLDLQLDLVFTIDDFVFGFCLQERGNYVDASDPQADAGVIGYITSLLTGGGFPRLAALVDRFGAASTWDRVAAVARDPERFDRNLARLLDGFAAEADLRRQRPRRGQKGQAQGIDEHRGQPPA